jgi:hypothetical protein
VSKKSPKIAALLDSLEADLRHPRHYIGYFACFNKGLYYEAHDVLEELWLRDRHGRDGNFFKGLIQLAGAFVHLQKNRLRPSSNLFRLALGNFAPYPPRHLDLDLDRVRFLCDDWLTRLAASDHEINPLTPGTAPGLALEA